jgi:hypothetical protein
MRLEMLIVVLVSIVSLAAQQVQSPGDKPVQPKPESKNASPGMKESIPAVQPKPLPSSVKKGLAYLVSQQNEKGGWGQGGGWRIGAKGDRIEGPEVKDPPDLADTCIATLALLRAGNAPKHGNHAKSVAKAIEFICNRVEKSDKDSLLVADAQSTQLQSKLGPYVDTFLAAWVLAEAKGFAPDEKNEKRLVAALDKVVAKIERHQREDGTWSHEGGWAPVLCQALACKGLNRAKQVGAKVTDKTLARAERYAAANFDRERGGFAAPGLGGAGFGGGGLGLGGLGGGGVPLYTQGGQLGGLQDSINTNRQLKDSVSQVAKSRNAGEKEKAKAQDQLRRFDEAEKVQEEAAKSILKQLDNKEFIQGFGSNGGEEFLSYMNISETLLAKGGKEWQKWDKQVSENLERIQNKDGSWSGDHCITGRTFCTASTLLVLMADRAPVPLAAKIKK